MEQVGILMISHGNFAKSALESAELIIGKQENCSSMGVFEASNIGELHEVMKEKVKELKTDAGLVVFTDLLGGSPNNIALTLLEDSDVLVCAGFNMPVLIETLMNRHLSLNELKEKIKEVYKDGLHIKTKEDLLGEDGDDDDML
jgi:PTS system mannose-specific IIA component